MPGKARKLPGKKGLFYPRRDGAYTYRGRGFSKITPSLDRTIAAKHKHRPCYPHEGDTSKRLRV